MTSTNASGKTNEVEWWLQVEIDPQYVKSRLDAIAVGGDIKLGVIIKAPIYYIVSWIKRPIRILTHDETFEKEVLKILDDETRDALKALIAKEPGRFCGLDESELKDLVLWKILRKLEEDERYTDICKLFKIPKDDAVSRLIMNAKAGNLRSKPSPPFTLASCEEVRRRISDLGPCHFVSADLRHFFYQIKICRSFQKLLVVLGKDKQEYAPCVLPMGHSWSPFLAQSVGWAIVLLNVKDGTAGDPRDVGDCWVDIPETLPDFIELKRKSDSSVAGFMTVYYDNVLIACQDRATALEWRQRLYANAHHCGAKWKKGKKWNEEKMRMEETTPIAGPDRFVNYIGVCYEWTDDCILHWCWPEKERVEFENSEVMSEEATEWTPRRVSSWIGVRQWKARIANQPFFHINDEMLLLSVIHSIARSRSWDTELTISEFSSMRSVLAAMRDAIVTPQKMERAWEQEERPVIYAVVDAATSTGMAVIWLDNQGRRYADWRDTYTIEERKKRRAATHVEARAIAEAVERTYEHGVTIRIASDCSSALQAILKGWSKSPEILSCIRRVYAALEISGNNLSLIHVKGSNNYADFHSRWQTAKNRPREIKSEEAFIIEDERRRARTWAVLNGDEEVKWEGKCKGF